MTPHVAIAKWTLEDYHQMIAAGILDDRRVELLNGEIIEMAPAGEPHAYYASTVANYLRGLLGDRAQISEGHPITIPATQSEPEPDIAVVQPLGRAYLRHHPYPENVSPARRKILTAPQELNSAQPARFSRLNGYSPGGPMAHLLHIDSSPRGERSHSRRMTREFVEAWQQHHPADTVTYRDVGRQPVPHVDEAWVAAAYTPEEQRTPELWEALKVSDHLIDELIAADILVVGSPMYNFSVTSTFKAYIDQIVRLDRTFTLDPEDAENPYRPLLQNKKMFVITARGGSGFGPGEPYGHMNHQDPYLRVAFEFIGIADITFVHVENEEHSRESLAASMAAARAQVAQLVAA